MFYYSDDNDYSDEDDEEIELSDDIKEELEYDMKINIINKFKSYITYESEFIGIKNISSGKILEIIENNKNNTNICSYDYCLNDYKIDLFNNLYIELFNKVSNRNMYNIITNKIFEVIYV